MVYETAPAKTVRVWADRRLFITAVVNFTDITVDYPVMTHKADYCTVLVSFVPEPAKRYVMQQAPSLTECAAMVTDVETQRPPRSFQIHPVGPSCQIRK